MSAGRRPSIEQCFAAALLGMLALMGDAHAQQRDLEPAVKATFLTRFAAFVRWPPTSFTDAAAPVVICVAGDGELAALVESAARGERIGSRSIEVRRYGSLPNGAECHIVYAAGSTSQTVPQMLAAVSGRPVLTVTDERWSRTRGMIHFVLDNGRVRFHINRDAADSVQLDMNSRLLSVALSVRSRRRA